MGGHRFFILRTVFILQYSFFLIVLIFIFLSFSTVKDRWYLLNTKPALLFLSDRKLVIREAILPPYKSNTPPKKIKTSH